MKLSVNLNKIALLRNARGEGKPSLDEFATVALKYNVSGITVHPRPDQRHITPEDVFKLKQLTDQHQKLLNIEGNPSEAVHGSFPGFIEIIKKNKPFQVTLVPDDSTQLTSDHGWTHSQKNDLKMYAKQLEPYTSLLSIFVDSDTNDLVTLIPEEIQAIEIFTGPYAIACESRNQSIIDIELEKIRVLAKQAKDMGLKVHAGHDLNLLNLKELVNLQLIDEVSIGHAIICDSLSYGFGATIEKYLEVING